MSERNRGRRWLPPLVVAAIAGVAFYGLHQTAPRSNVGYDVSYPQCKDPLPTGQAFGIVGINGGLADTLNPCMREEFDWALGSSGKKGLKAQLYLVGADPGPKYKGIKIRDWPDSGRNKFGTCNGSDDPACSFRYGFERGRADVASAQKKLGILRFGTAWIDTEIEGTWQDNQADNAAAIEGFAAALEDAGDDPGIYSSRYQFIRIIGRDAASSFVDFPEWVTGSTTARAARQACAIPLVPGAPVILSQVTSASSSDQDHLCR